MKSFTKYAILVAFLAISSTVMISGCKTQAQKDAEQAQEKADEAKKAAREALGM